MEYTKYEKARIVGARALQLSMGAPMLVKLKENELGVIGYNVLKIASIEFEKGVVPITVERPL
ncbi:MAG: DNA-directed RNA polymerase subunit K [Nanoarchaeota archaeon]